MRQTIIGQIELGNFNLKDMIDRIDYYHVAGKLTTAEREELVGRAREKAVADMDVEPKTEILALWEAVHALQDKVAALQAEDGGNGGNEQSDLYPPFVQPTGAHDAYRIGQGCTFNGKHYTSTIDNNVWAPDVYPNGWKEEA